MGFFNAVGQKLKQAAGIGSKILGKAADIGHKVSNVGGSVLNALNSVPVLGDAIRNTPVLGTVNNALRAGFGVADKLSYAADAGSTALSAFSNKDYNRAAKLAEGGARLAYNTVKSGIEKSHAI